MSKKIQLFTYPDDYIIKNKRGKEIPLPHFGRSYSHTHSNGESYGTLTESDLECMLDNCRNGMGEYEIEVEHDRYTISFYEFKQSTQKAYDEYVKRIMSNDKATIENARNKIKQGRKFLQDNDIHK